MQKKRNSLTDIEVSVIKRLLADGKDNTYIIGIINTKRGSPDNHVSSGRISNIKNNQIKKYVRAPIATDAQLEEFMALDVLELNESPISLKILDKILPIKSKKPLCLNIKETDILECKESFARDTKALIKPIVSFANNKGGYILYGIKDKTWDVVGLSDNAIKAFDTWDNESLSKVILNYLSCGIDFAHKLHNICGKTIGVLYIFPARKKPVILIKDDNDKGISSGQIYYRYSGMNSLIRPSELEKIIEDRTASVIQMTLSKHIETIIKNGIENSAVINLSTGLVTGKSGTYVIDDSLLSKIKFVKEGEFVEVEGAPALKLIGDLKSTNSIFKTEVEVGKDIRSREIVEAFLEQNISADPMEYVKSIGLEMSTWLPIFYFIATSRRTREDIVKYYRKLINLTGSNFPEKQIQRLINSRMPPPSLKSKQTMIKQIVNKEDISIDSEEKAMHFLASISVVEKSLLDLSYCLNKIKIIFNDFWAVKDIQRSIKYTCSYLDICFYNK